MRATPRGMSHLGFLALLAAVLPLQACSASRSGASPFVDARGALRGPSVTVLNRSFHDVRVYLLLDSWRYSLGSVGSQQEGTFRVPSSLLSTDGVRLVADPIGSRDAYVSEWIPAARGDHVEWTLSSNFALSTYVVRSGGQKEGAQDR